ncbi:hypothetical protein C8R45DRAFT_973198 [Mycena sanguinolenta]|nr:hypothetical protein C8R45DRAFT_973198 [Mycena sanguinolenta]
MVRFSQGTLVVLWFCVPGILPMTITGPSSGQSNSIVTFTWTSVSSDPTLFEIDIDEALNTLNQSDQYSIINDLSTASGSATVTLPVLSVGTHRIAFSSTDGFQILAEGSIEILAPSSSSSPSSSTLGSSTSVPVPSSTPPVSTSSSTSPQAASSIPSTSSSSESSSAHSQSATSEAPKSASSDQSSPSPAATSSISQSSSAQSQAATSEPQESVPSAFPGGATKHHSNAGAIAGGVVGGAVIILLALLGWWYFYRRRSSAAAGESYNDTLARPQFLVSPISSALTGARAVHNESINRPWETNETTTVSSAATPASATSGVTSRKQPIIIHCEPSAVHTTQSDDGPSREEVQQLLGEVQRLREHIGAISPPAYSGE